MKNRKFLVINNKMINNKMVNKLINFYRFRIANFKKKIGYRQKYGVF